MAPHSGWFVLVLAGRRRSFSNGYVGPASLLAASLSSDTAKNRVVDHSSVPAFPACHTRRVTCSLADENGSQGWLRPTNIRINSAAFCSLNYSGINKMVEAEGLAPPKCLGVGQVPWLLGDASKVARPMGAAPIFSS